MEEETLGWKDNIHSDPFPVTKCYYWRGADMIIRKDSDQGCRSSQDEGGYG